MASAENIRSGKAVVATPGTLVPLVTDGPRRYCTGVVIRALSGNTGLVTVGGVDAFTHAGGQGITLSKTDQPIRLGACDLGDIRVDAATGGDGVQFLSSE